MVPSQKTNGDNLGILFFNFLHYNCMLSVHIEAILMSTHHIQFHDKIRKFP